MNLLWNLVGKPMAALGGRSFQEMSGRTAGDCDKSVAVGLMCLVSLAIIFTGHWLFWSHFLEVPDTALPVAAGITLLFAVVYRVALRSMEPMGGLGKLVMLVPVHGLMGINALLAGHEVPLLAFRPQAEEQARLGAARGVTAYASAVEKSLGLPQLRTSSTELDKAVATAMTERSRIPEVVKQFQQQATACEPVAARLKAAIPPDEEDPGYAAAVSAWRQKRAGCNALTAKANAALSKHQTQLDNELSDLGKSRERVRKSLDAANTQHEENLKRDTPTLTASATTGFARHAAMWAAVAAGTVPTWAAWGMMAAVLVLDGFSFLIKLFARDDRVTAERIQACGTDRLYNQLHAAMLRQQARLAGAVVRGLHQQTHEDLSQLVRSAVMPAVMQGIDERAFDRAAQATQRAQRKAGVPSPSMLERLSRMARAMRARAAGTARMPGAAAAA